MYVYIYIYTYIFILHALRETRRGHWRLPLPTKTQIKKLSGSAQVNYLFLLCFVVFAAK